MIGVFVPSLEAREAVESIKVAEDMGVGAVWLTQAGVAPDSMAVLAAAAAVTERIKLGTAIIPTWPRAAVLIAQQALAIDMIAPGRFRLGIGPSTAAGMEPLYGVKYRRPMKNLREYLATLQALLHQGRVKFEGEFVQALARLSRPAEVQVMASALSPGAFRVCGEAAEGAISWMCAWRYLRDTALPAMAEGAKAAGRDTPPLIAHVPVCLSEDREEVRRAAREQVGRYSQFPPYQAMFAAAGYGDVSGGLTDELIDDLVVSGTAAAVRRRLEEIIGEGAGEVLVHPLITGDDRNGYVRRVYEAISGR